MYRVEFFDIEKKRIATHYINGDKWMPTLLQVELYCLNVCKLYPMIISWNIRKFQSRECISGTPF